MATALTDASDEVEEPKLFCRESDVCGDSVGVQYYAPLGVIKRGRGVIKKHSCFHCYSDSHLSKNNDVEAREERRGQGYLHMCKECLNNGVPVVYKRGKVNRVQVVKEKSRKRNVGQESCQSRNKV